MQFSLTQKDHSPDGQASSLVPDTCLQAFSLCPREKVLQGPGNPLVLAVFSRDPGKCDRAQGLWGGAGGPD